jgi:hypothetical protein
MPKLTSEVIPAQDFGGVITSPIPPAPSLPAETWYAMFKWEAGELSEDDTITLFQALVNTGLAWRLQGCYGRTAMAMINADTITRRF